MKNKIHMLARFWILIISSIFTRNSVVFLAFSASSEINESVLTILGFTSFFNNAALALLLFWNKIIGFWIFLGIQIINTVISLASGIGLFKSLLWVISVGILWILLQLPRDDGANYSSWDYLTGNIPPVPTGRLGIKKCRLCNTEYAGSEKFCPNCISFSYEEIGKKKCRMCRTEYAGSENVCPQCGSFLYEEICKE
jgi:hypothetical protein